ncbi:histidine--tRNA ligase [Candidatus Woesearchaeota archaeon]|nr:histidine--tRNA ligase [Candidatus Woesearchaeota archaeon]
MVMETLQIRLTKGLIEEIQKLVDRQIYSSVSEAIRDAVRKMVVGRDESKKETPGGKPIPPEVQQIQEAIEKEVKGELQRARGTRDFLPESQIIRQQIASTLRETFELYGYSPLETPAIERFDILASKYAGGAEILKETFRFRDQGNRDVALRYDLTVPLARVIGMNPQLKMPFKRYQIGDVFRDGPVNLGRYRQFVQCDVDVVGSKDMAADAEILSIMKSALSRLGFESEIRVNNRKILDSIMVWAGVEKEKTETVMLSLDKLEKFGKDAVTRELLGKGLNEDIIAKILNVAGLTGRNEEKITSLKNIVGDIDGLKEMERLLELVDAISVEATFEPSLARGLAYYTGTIYETFIKGSSITSSVCSGGRWDNMIGQFLGRGEYPAVGTSFGLDRLYDAIIERNQGKPAIRTVTKVFVIPIGTLDKSIKIAQQFREAGIKTEIDLMGRGVSKNLNYANSLGIPYAVFIGEDELRQNKVKVRDMASGEESLASINEAFNIIKS